MRPGVDPLLEFVHRHTQARGVPPSYREIAAHMGWASTNAVSDAIKVRMKHGLITRGKFMGARVLKVHALGIVS